MNIPAYHKLINLRHLNYYLLYTNIGIWTQSLLYNMGTIASGSEPV